MIELSLSAHASGPIVPLDRIPDPLLSRGLGGPGIAVDPVTGSLMSPLAGTVQAVDLHARTISVQSDDGLAVLLQAGLGRGASDQGELWFLVKTGQRVEAGEILGEFDADRLARHLESLLCVLTVTGIPGGRRLDRLTAQAGQAEGGRTPLLTVHLDGNATRPGWVDLLAPLSGVLVPLETVPDPVFAQKMVGDGISLDPTDSLVLAPAAGSITQIHASRHAVTITTAEGLELLLHVGIDTVGLRGEGFQALVHQGDQVVAGQPLLRFDADLVAGRAVSLLTQLLVANGDRVASLEPSRGLVVAGRDPVCRIHLKSAPGGSAESGATSPAVTAGPVVLGNPAGLHARPAATLAAAAKKFQATIQVIRPGEGGRPGATANARSLVAILGLGTRQGDRITVSAQGEDAAAAAQAIADLLASGCGEDLTCVRQAVPVLPPAPLPKTVDAPAVAAHPGHLLAGAPASAGLAIGRIHHLRRADITIAEHGGPPAQEWTSLELTLTTVKNSLTAQAAQDPDPTRKQILGAHLELLADPDLRAATLAGIDAGRSAAFAWQEAIARQAAVLEGLDNPLLRERAADLRDVGRQVLARLAGVDDRPQPIPEGAILVAEELTPSDTTRFAPGTVLGFCTTTGGATSHVAILARSLGIPAVCGIDARVLTLAEGATVILDGSAGTLDPAPEAAALAEATARRDARSAAEARHRAAAHRPATTVDGVRIEVVANVTSAAEAEAAVAAGGEGVGLLRSEFLFDHRTTAPSEDEQAACYAGVARALGPERPLVVRTLDVGGDKPLAYLPLPAEENPFLGMRGLRVSLDRPDLFRVQVRAILRAAGLAKLHVMFPMVTSVDELRTARAIVEEERAILGGPAIKIGVMIEVPAAALLAEHLAREADFFSIGTNDLTQYVLAMDRGHPRLARQADALHPAVLTAIRLTCAGAHAHGRWVGVCGGLAGDELAVPALIGLGVDELSVPVPAIPGIKAAVARCHRARCTALAEELLTLSTALEVRAKLTAFAALHPDAVPAAAPAAPSTTHRALTAAARSHA